MKKGKKKLCLCKKNYIDYDDDDDEKEVMFKKGKFYKHYLEDCGLYYWVIHTPPGRSHQGCRFSIGDKMGECDPFRLYFDNSVKMLRNEKLRKLGEVSNSK